MDINQHLEETVWCTLAPSKIHGVGVFAVRDIPRGQKLYLQGTGEEFTWSDHIKEPFKTLILSRWPERKTFLHPHSDAWFLSFMNHSRAPNYDHESDVALEAIHTGEEITEDYGFDI